MTGREREIYELIEHNPLISQDELAGKTGISRSSVAVHISNLMKKGFIIGKGYILQKPSYVTVFGAANMDICGMPDSPLIRQDSNPGTVRISMGGVGRNIARNLSLLGCSVKFISAFGDDEYAGQIQDSCRKAGIDTHESIVSGSFSTSIYLYITRHDGDMELAVNDMRIYSLMTPEFISGKAEVLKSSRLIVVDANLPEETIEAVCKNSSCPVFAETVSCAKAVRFRNVFPYIHTITPNLQEAEILTGLSINPDSRDSLAKAAKALLDMGVKHVVITLGSKGCFISDGKTRKIIRPFPAEMVNVNGAGDALMSGLAAGFDKGFSFEESALLGMAAAGMTLETPETNNPALNLEAAMARAGLHQIMED